MSKHVKRVQSDFFQGAHYYIERREAKAGEHFRPHWHDYFEFEMVLSGTGTHIYNQNHHFIQRGSAYLMSYYDFHELTVESPMRLLKVQFDRQMLPEELSHFFDMNRHQICVAFNEDLIGRIETLFDRIEQERTDRAPFSELAIRNAIAFILIELLRALDLEKQETVPALLQKATAEVHRRFREELPLSRLAEEIFVTPNYLGRCFSRWLGMSYVDYLNHVRLRYACDLLIGTDLSVKEIAFSSGYHSVEHFHYVFKHKLSCTPLAFRRMNHT